MGAPGGVRQGGGGGGYRGGAARWGGSNFADATLTSVAYFDSYSPVGVVITLDLVLRTGWAVGRLAW